MATNLNFGTALTGTALAGTAFQRASILTGQQFQVRDNSEFVKVFDPVKVIGVGRPTRTLVVSQSPAAGELVPVGTPIDLIVTVKAQLPIGGIKEIDPRILERFNNKNIGDLLGTLDNTDAKKVLDRPDVTDYDGLSTADKAAVNTYLSSTYNFDAAGDAAAAKNVYNNVKFLYTL